MERDDGGWLRPILILLFLAAPAVGVRIASHFSDDPYLQPLALTSEGLAAIGERGSAYGQAMIEVEVDWGRDWEGRMTRAALREQIARSLSRRTDNYRFRFRDAPGTGIAVSFVVGSNRYGPFGPGTMSSGVYSALVALDMANRPEG